jgi:hypothetical protein
MTDLHHVDRLIDVAERVEQWLHAMRHATPAIVAVDRAAASDIDEGFARWYVRMAGDEKEFTTVWLTLGQRTLRYETYVMPYPHEHATEVFEHVLRRNERMVGAHFSIGEEDGVFLRGELPLAALNESELDRIVGSLYAYVEAAFPTLIRLGFPLHFGS